MPVIPAQAGIHPTSVRHASVCMRGYTGSTPTDFANRLRNVSKSR